MAEPTMPCTYEFSRGYGTGVAEALGNWGFSNQTCNAGQELRRLKCLFAEIDSLRSNNKPVICVKYDRRYDPDAWYVKPSPDECKPAWTFPVKRPLITYCSTATIMKVSNLRDVGSELTHVIPGRSYVKQGVCIYSFNEFNHLKRASKAFIIDLYNYHINFGYTLYLKVDTPYNYIFTFRRPNGIVEVQTVAINLAV